MRTDVKVGLICAVAIVLCVVLYFVMRGNSRQLPNSPQARSGGTPSLVSPRPDPLIPSGSSGGSVTGGMISFPGGATAATAPATAPGLAGTPVIPGLGADPGLGTGARPTGAPGTSGLPITSLAETSTVRPTLEITAGTSGLTTSAGPTTYKIQKGDMLSTISKKFNVSVHAIETANPGIDSTRLKIDAVIKIPAPTAPSVTAGPATRPAGISPAPRSIATAPPTTRPAAPAGSTAIKPGTTYTVKKGDTLSTIARAAYGSNATGWKKIFQANRTELNDPDNVPVGAKIVIPQ